MRFARAVAEATAMLVLYLTRCGAKVLGGSIPTRRYRIICLVPRTGSSLLVSGGKRQVGRDAGVELRACLGGGCCVCGIAGGCAR